ncbi:hypothetical protein [Mesorhizobium sp. B2-1-3A]|nr:hypothetical protein [Mesorhizobium sp. B2-1-3A]
MRLDALQASAAHVIKMIGSRAQQARRERLVSAGTGIEAMKKVA